MKEVAISEFKAKCLSILEEVARRGSQFVSPVSVNLWPKSSHRPVKKVKEGNSEAWLEV
jgi:hypothetical protein